MYSFQFLFVVTYFRHLYQAFHHVLVSFRCYIYQPMPVYLVKKFQFLFVVTIEAGSEGNTATSFSFFSLLLSSITVPGFISKFQFLFVVTQVGQSSGTLCLKVLVSFRCYEGSEWLQSRKFQFQFLFVVTSTSTTRIYHNIRVLVSFRCYITIWRKCIVVYRFQFLFVVTKFNIYNCTPLYSFSFFSLLHLRESNGLLSILMGFSFFSLLPKKLKYQFFVNYVLVSFRCYRLSFRLKLFLGYVLVSFRCYGYSGTVSVEANACFSFFSLLLYHCLL